MKTTTKYATEDLLKKALADITGAFHVPNRKGRNLAMIATAIKRGALTLDDVTNHESREAIRRVLAGEVSA